MTELLSVTPEAIQDVVRAILRRGLDVDVASDFVASVDWSDTESAGGRVKELLGELEMWTTEFDEGDLSRSEYIGRLLSLLPTGERKQRLVMGDCGQPPFVTNLATDPERPSQIRRAAVLPQTGSGARSQSAAI